MTDFRDADLDTLRELIDQTEDPEELEALAIALGSEYPWEPQPHQLPPPGEPPWTWCFQGGRGTGKTDTGAHYTDEHMSGPPCDHRWPGGHKGLLIGPTHADVVASTIRGVSGLIAHNPGVRQVGRKDGTFAIWPNGAEAVCLGMHTEQDAERLRAQAANTCFWWIDEAAIGRHLSTAVDNLRFGARGVLGGRQPHGIATTTPKATPAYKSFLRMPGVAVTYASSYQNRYLTAEHRELIAHYEGTRLGRQEIYGELVDDYEGALFDRQTLAEDRITDPAILALDADGQLSALGCSRTFTGIDPSTWIPEIGAPPADDEYEGGAGIETGIVTIGIDRRWPPHIYVTEDRSGRVAAIEWARRAVAQHYLWHSTIVPETNAGGDLVLATIALTDATVPIYREFDPETNKLSKKPGVRARIGKRARAEPVGALSDQHRLHMVGEFPALESTLCGWDPTENWSPDRLDAFVWAVHGARPWRKRTTAGVGGRGSTRR